VPQQAQARRQQRQHDEQREQVPVRRGRGGLRGRCRGCGARGRGREARDRPQVVRRDRRRGHGRLSRLEPVDACEDVDRVGAEDDERCHVGLVNPPQLQVLRRYGKSQKLDVFQEAEERVRDRDARAASVGDE